MPCSFKLHGILFAIIYYVVGVGVGVVVTGAGFT